jgi:hypothetical protein
MAEMQWHFPPGRQMQELINGPRRSKLTLAARQEGSGTVQIDSLRRVREPVSRSKSTRAKWPTFLADRSRHAESQNELKAFRVLMATGRPDAWQEQPFRLEYHHEGSQHRYTPDILVAWGAHQEVVEIKEDSDAESPENKARFTLVRELLAEHGFSFECGKSPRFALNPA